MYKSLMELSNINEIQTLQSKTLRRVFNAPP